MKNHAHRIGEELPWVLCFVAVIWGVFIFDWVWPGNFNYYGLIPRHTDGLLGIVTMPFLHGDWAHIVSNTAPLLVLLTLLAGSKANSGLIVVVLVILSGLLLWLFGRGASIHIGASGLVFGLAVFLMVSGLLERRTIPLIITLVVGFFYGSSLLSGIIPGQSGVSWDGHLFGALAGAITSWILIKYIRPSSRQTSGR